MEPSKQHPLCVKIEDGKLVISIGIETLCFATENCERFYDPEKDRYAFKVTDAAKFASDVALSLQHEEEDGSTPVSRLLDAACEDAIEGGSEGIEEKQ